MTEVTLEKLSRQARDLFNKGSMALERGNLDYAINLLFACVQEEPRLLQAWKFLRAAELQKAKQSGGNVLKRSIATVKNMPAQLQVMALLRKGKAQEAVMAVEKLLRADPLNLAYIKLFADAAAKADLIDAAILTMEIAHEHYPEDKDVMKRMGELYQANGQHEQARDTFEKLCALMPNDPDAVRALKNAMALHSMSSDGWSDTAARGGTYREVMKDTDEAVLLERESKAVKSDKDADALIADMLQKIAAEPANVNYYRALARLYAQRKMFDDAIATLNRALETNPGDPELEAALSAMQLQKFDFDIGELKTAGDEAAATAKEQERDEFLFADLTERVRRYPNDQKLRYEWGVMLFERGQTTEAVQQFQISQRNPKYRVLSLYYIGVCFKQKKQYDLAAQQFETALKDLPSMDQIKKNICYELGVVSELTGDQDRAVDCYKQIYQVDIGYRDVAQKIERLYHK
jgi:tetratricopeptide (TPR) repeat protein